MVSMEPLGDAMRCNDIHQGGFSATLCRTCRCSSANPRCLGLVAVAKAPAELMGAASALINVWRGLAGAAG
uniref:Uncharacterized protein n=1 Tax=Acidithiobacillus sulfuriphilus TaxID=1867749 RepID=A0A3M8QSR5_9PROT|nr:hypothetical protein EC580_11800 [Acidithiobacillus sulfuriphilus]